MEFDGTEYNPEHSPKAVDMPPEGKAVYELKSCPFCGTRPVGPESGDSEWWVECERCEIIMEHFSKRELIRRWNNRSTKE